LSPVAVGLEPANQSLRRDDGKVRVGLHRQRIDAPTELDLNHSTFFPAFRPRASGSPCLCSISSLGL
jgi:hypothetical protein